MTVLTLSILPTIVCYLLLVVHCDWFAFMSRRAEYLAFIPAAIAWPVTAVVALVVWFRNR